MTLSAEQRTTKRLNAPDTSVNSVVVSVQRGSQVSLAFSHDAAGARPAEPFSNLEMGDVRQFQDLITEGLYYSLTGAPDAEGQFQVTGMFHEHTGVPGVVPRAERS